MVQKAVKKIVKAKKVKPISKSKLVFNSIAETLQANSPGEFDLPSILTRYNEKSHPKHKLGLHREFYISSAINPKFHESDTMAAKTLFQNQASIIASAILGEGIPIKDKVFDLPLCKDCE